MFYSAHDNVLPFHLVGIGLAKDQTTEEKASSKVMLETVLAVQGFHSSASELLTIHCSSGAMNNTATKSKCVYLCPLREIYLGQEGATAQTAHSAHSIYASRISKRNNQLHNK